MADLFWLTRAQIRQIAPDFPLSHGAPQVDDQRVVSDIPHLIPQWPVLARRACRVRAAQTLYNRSRAMESPCRAQPHLCRTRGPSR